MSNFESSPHASQSQTQLPSSEVSRSLAGLRWVTVLTVVAAHALASGCSGEPGEQSVRGDGSVQGVQDTEQASEALLQTRSSATPNTDDQSFEIEGAAPDRTQGSGAEGQIAAKAETFTCTLTCTDNGWTCGNDCFGSEGTWCWTENLWQGGHWGGWSPYVCVSASGTTTYH